MISTNRHITFNEAVNCALYSHLKNETPPVFDDFNEIEKQLLLASFMKENYKKDRHIYITDARTPKGEDGAVELFDILMSALWEYDYKKQNFIFSELGRSAMRNAESFCKKEIDCCLEDAFYHLKNDKSYLEDMDY